MKFIRNIDAKAGAAFVALSFGAILCLGVLSASAATVNRNTLIKGPGQGATVYYLASDGKRYVFPNQKTYQTWFSGYSGVVQVTSQELASYPLGGNVTYRPGIRMVKITTDPKVYAVDNGGALRWVASESVAVQLYGSNWNQKIDDVPDAFFTNYRLGSPVYGASDFSPFTAAQGSATINQDKYLPAGTEPRLADTAPDAPGSSGSSGSYCSADVWDCGTWSGCSTGGSQSRGCVLSYDCPGAATVQPETVRSCSAPSYSSGSAGVGLAPDDYESQDASVVGGQEIVLAKYRLTAQYEAMKLTKASFTVDTPAAVVSLGLYDGTILVGGPVTVDGAGNAFFSDVNFTIPANASKNLTVKGVLGAVGKNGVPSGSDALVTLKDTAGAYVFEMRGASVGSNTVVSSLPGGDRPGNDKIMRRTVPTVSLEDLPTSVLTPGDIVALRFSVAADAGSDLSLKALAVNIQKPSDAAVTPTAGVSLRRVGDGSNLLGAAAGSSGCAASGGTVCLMRLLFTDEEVIAAGTTRTYDARLNIGGHLSRGDSLSTVLLGDVAPLTGTMSGGSSVDQVSIIGADANFVWSDQSVLPHSASIGASSADWANGAFVRVLPTDAQTLSK